LLTVGPASSLARRQDYLCGEEERLDRLSFHIHKPRLYVGVEEIGFSLSLAAFVTTLRQSLLWNL
jgi:hypothetical protein